MADPDRLLQLRRQRALVAQHLAWLDGEITRASGGSAENAPSQKSGPFDLATRSMHQVAPPNRSTASSDAEMEKIFHELAEEDSSSSSISKSGCWMIFAAVVFFSLAVIVGFILFRYR